MNLRNPLLAGLTACAALAAGRAVAAEGEPSSAAQVSATQVSAAQNSATQFNEQVKPFLAKFCINCHGGGQPKAELALDQYADFAAAANDRAVWDKVLENLRGETMPPADQPQPAAAQRDAVIGWIEAQFPQLDCNGPKDPGRVTIRRLNRTEYDNTVRDLLGVDFHPAENFPADDVGYGFDHIGDVLSMPPILLEKYLAAAEQLAENAIYVDGPEKLPRQRFVATAAGHSGGSHRGSYLGFSSTGEVFADVEFPSPGEYFLRGRAFGDQAGDEPAKMAFRLEGKQVYLADVTAVESAPAVYEKRLRVGPGKKRFALAFVNDYYRPQEPDPKQRDRNLAIEYLEVQGPLGYKPPELPESHRRIIFCVPDEKKKAVEKKKAGVHDCAKKILKRFASHAFRRAAGAEEVERLARFVDQAVDDGETFERGIQLAVEAVLVSPHFLFRVELDAEGGKADGSDAEGVHLINEFELATRLSYFLWSSMPDDDLFQHAFAGTLRQGDNLASEVRRMLKHPKSRALVDNFAMQWLQVRRLKLATPDTKRFPTFDDGLRRAMLRETELCFAHIMNDDRSLLEFLDADYTFLNERLAKHYGIAGVTGDEFRRVPLSDPDRGGVLTQASVLTVTSNPTRTSPVKRGKWILEQILGTPPPPPPPGAGELRDDEQVALTGSLRQRMEQHRANPSCAQCHARMDPLGFGLENFDAIGAWRDRDGSFFIDASGTLPDGSSFKRPSELKAILKARKREFATCFTEKMLTYALGRGLEYYDKCTTDEIAAALDHDGYKFWTLIQRIVASEPFQKRRRQGTKP
ncbi:MAG TPA: DUF1592 domain-containing protein [Pirellulales bacterium]|nr:DUF1592 domain-containing protein [Pirellulales bacterium]